MHIGEVIIQLVTSFFASAAFGVMFNVPRRALPACGFTGMMGWIVYWVLNPDLNVVIATLIASFVVAVSSNIFARAQKHPMIVFNVSGIIPLVPGGMAYDAMRHFVENENNLAIELAVRVSMISGAIALGLVLSEVSYQLFIKKSKGLGLRHQKQR